MLLRLSNLTHGGTAGRTSDARRTWQAELEGTFLLLDPGFLNLLNACQPAPPLHRDLKQEVNWGLHQEDSLSSLDNLCSEAGLRDLSNPGKTGPASWGSSSPDGA